MQPEQMTVVLTGACGGIGQVIARQLADAGASLFLCDRDEAVLAGLQQALRAGAKPGQYIEAQALDLMNDQQVDQWLKSKVGRR